MSATAKACAVLGLIVALAASSSAASGGVIEATLTPKCATSGLVVWLDTQGSGAAGSTYYNLGFTNLFGYACTLLGYPGVSAVDLGGRRLGSAASRADNARAKVVRLAPGGTASAVLQLTDVANLPRATCRPLTAAGWRVYPPNQIASKVVPFPFGACSRSGPLFLHEETVRATG